MDLRCVNSVQFFFLYSRGVERHSVDCWWYCVVLWFIAKLPMTVVCYIFVCSFSCIGSCRRKLRAVCAGWKRFCSGLVLVIFVWRGDTDEVCSSGEAVAVVELLLNKMTTVADSRLVEATHTFILCWIGGFFVQYFDFIWLWFRMSGSWRGGRACIFRIVGLFVFVHWSMIFCIFGLFFVFIFICDGEDLEL